MQKRIRKNSDYICPKKLKLEIIGNNDQERMDGTTISSQYVQSKDIDINSEPFARSIPSAEATTTSDFGDVNIVDKIPAANPNIKINSKSDTNDTDTIDFKDIYQKIQKSDENSTRDGGVTSSSVNTNKIPSTSVMHLRDISDNQKTSGLSTKQDVTDSTESNAFKLLQRENDILINLDTIATMENINSHVTADGNSLCVSNENDLFASDLNSMQNDILEYKKSVESQPLGMKIDDESRTIKTNTIMQMNAVNDKKKLQTEQQSSAKVSLGNTTISVPLLKPLNLRRFITNNECKSVSNLCKVINIQGKQIKTPTIVQLSQVQLNPKTNTKIVQATLVGNKIQLPNVALKTSANFSMKPNVVTTTQCTMMNPGALPKQIFDDEVVYLEKSVPNSQPQQDEVESRSIENLPINTSNNKPVSKLKDQLNNKLTNSEDYITKTTSPFLTQLRVIEAANTNTSPQTRLTDILPSPITVVTSGENPLPRTTASVSTTISKVSKKPIMLTKTVSPSESLTTSIMNTDSNDILRTTTSSSDGNVPKDNNTPHISDQQAIHKLLEENLLSQKQFTHVVQNGNRLQLKVNKCPERCDDIRTKRPDKNGDFLNKRQPANKLGPFVGSNDITPHEKVNNPKSDDSQNVLLKHLLQSSSNQRTTPPCTQTLAQRKLTTVRAPSLGLVSSLEAQLARPVIPPVPSVGEMKTDIKLPNKTIMGEKISKKLPGERENATIKTRPEIVSRETSFVSSFSPKVKCTEADRTTTITPTSTTVPPMPTISSTTLHQPATTSNIQAILTNIQTSAMITQSNNNFNQAIITSSTNSPGSNSIHSAVPPNMHIGQPSRLSPYTNISQSIEMDSIRRSPFHTTIANANGNTNSINTFTMFKSREEDIINRTPFESNSNPTSTKMSSPENSSEVKNPPQNDGDINVHDKAKQAKLDAENLEMKKRFKRDHQKHKRQILLTKEQQNHQKKKSRKLSKASEDFDEFIDNKVVQMKQMFVLEVLEPLLSTYLGICSIYGYTERPRNEVEPSSHNSSKEEFGKTTIKNVADFYSVKPYGPNQNKQANNVPTFQNKFYDEEFPNMNQISCDKLFQFINNLKQQSLQTPDEITLIHNQPSHSQPSSSAIRTTNYPGIKLQSNMNLNTDRMSPVIPLITPNHFGPFKRRKPPMTTNRKKSSSNNAESSLILTLSSFVAQNVVNILRDLENLLNVNSPISYKLLNTDKLNNINSVHGDRGRILQRTESTNIQNILNGTYKCCRNCHLIIICGIVGADSNANIKKKIMSDSHFCEKFCSIQYKKKGRRFVLSQHKDHCYPNNKALNRVNTGDSACCDISNYKIVTPNCFWRPLYKTMPNSEDVNDVYLKTRVAIALNPNRDVRRCILCNQKRDALPEGASRLLNYDVNKWVHLNCALWSNSVYETTNGGLMNLELTMPQGLHEVCSHCNQLGASVKCFKIRCGHVYHLPCAIKERCVFYKNKTIHCASHAHRLEKKNELSSIRVRRRVYIERDENRQVAAVMHHLDLSNLLRVGSLTFINVGQLLPHQLEAFHTPNCIYPIGYKVIRFFWSTRKLNKRCRYICSIVDSNGRPEFVIQIQEPFESDVELRDVSPKAVWQHVLDKIVELRKGQEVLQIYADFFTGEDLFGLTEPSIVRILESLPGVETLTDYKFKYGRNPLLELPLALNPSGSARTEPKLKQNLNWKKTHTQRTSSINLKLSLSPSSLAPGDVACPYSKQFVHSKSSQYRKMKQEWRNNVYLARSKIQGLGLYAARDLEKHTMVIEYIGQVIRTEVSELREKQYDQRNRGIYMFRLDEERVVDATLSGGLARYINHSCNPNCVTEIVDVDREYRIIIFAKRRINKGEELSYDYKFDIEDDAHKISCMCDAPNCRKWMN